MDKLRERARRLSDIRALGDQVAQVRRVGLRGEVLVPIIAVLILAVTLGLSALAPDTTTTAVPGATASAVAEASLTATPNGLASQATPGSYPVPSVSAAPALGGYPSASVDSSLVATPSLTDTDTIAGALTPTVAGYPGTGPEGVGVPPSGGFPDTGNNGSFPTPPPNSGGTSAAFPTPALLPPTSAAGSYPVATTPPRLPVATAPSVQQPVSTPPSTGGSGSYPSPATATPADDPQPGDAPVGGETPVGEPDGTTPGASTAPGAPTAPAATPTPGTPTPTPVPPTPTARPAEVLSGNVRWTAANSPIVISENQLVAPGAFLTIEPGVEVRFAPDVRLEVAGTLRASGTAGAPIRLVGPDGRWDGIVGDSGSTIALEGVTIRQAGRNGTAVSSSGGALAIHSSSITDSGGGVVAIGSVLDLRGTQISGNAIGGPAVNVVLPQQNGTVIAGNIVGGNGGAAGAPQIQVTGGAAPGTFSLENNQIIGEAGPGALLTSDAPLAGTIRCNSFQGGTIGLQITTKRPDTAGFNLAIDTNAFGSQSRFGAAGSLAFNLLNNWWGDASGPLDAQRNPQGRGVPIGVGLQFQPWLAERPACAPR